MNMSALVAFVALAFVGREYEQEIVGDPLPLMETET